MWRIVSCGSILILLITIPVSVFGNWDNWEVAKTDGEILGPGAVVREMQALAEDGLERAAYDSDSFFADVFLFQSTHARMNGCDFPANLKAEDWSQVRKEAGKIFPSKIKKKLKKRFDYLSGCLREEALYDLYADISLSYDRFFKVRDESLGDLLVEGLLDMAFKMECTLPPQARTQDSEYHFDLAKGRPPSTLARILLIRTGVGFVCPGKKKPAKGEPPPKRDRSDWEAQKNAYFEPILAIQEKWIKQKECPVLEKKSIWKSGSGLDQGLGESGNQMEKIVENCERLLPCMEPSEWESYFSETASQIATWLQR